MAATAAMYAKGAIVSSILEFVRLLPIPPLLPLGLPFSAATGCTRRRRRLDVREVVVDDDDDDDEDDRRRRRRRRFVFCLGKA